MKKINIKGKEYIPVNERLKAFRNEFKDYSLIGQIIAQTPDSVIFEARIIDDKGVVRANGFARETTQKGGVNKFAMLENAETSAWGRALGNFGIGIDDAVCTADELEHKLEYEELPAPAKALPALSERVEKFKKFIQTANEQQLTSDGYKTKFNDLCKQAGMDTAEELTRLHNERLAALTTENKEEDNAFDL